MSISQTARSQRIAAGEDPAKRDQILAGAHSVFTRLGFDVASMSDISREAGVSKGTLYVYFADKEHLFTALMDRERDRLFAGVSATLETAEPIAVRLRNFGIASTTILCSDPVIRAQRIVIGISERMPDISAGFFDRGGIRAVNLLATCFEEETRKGTLRVADPRRAAFQLAELFSAGLFRRRLFGHMAQAPSTAEVTETVDAALDLFLARYARP